MLTWTEYAKLNQFITGYVDAMLWAENDESTPSGGEPLDASYSADDVAPETHQRIVDDCRAFYAANRADLERGPSKLTECSPLEFAGHDLWLTSRHHGCGFWDGDWPEDVGERLTAAAQHLSENPPYVGDDGLVYLD